MLSPLATKSRLSRPSSLFYKEMCVCRGREIRTESSEYGEVTVACVELADWMGQHSDKILYWERKTTEHIKRKGTIGAAETR